MADPKATAPPLTDADVEKLIEWPTDNEACSYCDDCGMKLIDAESFRPSDVTMHLKDCRRVAINRAISELLSARQRENKVRDAIRVAQRAFGSVVAPVTLRESRMITALNVAQALLDAPSAERGEPAPAKCPKCSTVMVQTFDYRRVNAIAETATPNGGFTCFKCGHAIAAAERGEQETTPGNVDDWDLPGQG